MGHCVILQPLLLLQLCIDSSHSREMAGLVCLIFVPLLTVNAEFFLVDTKSGQVDSNRR